MNNRDVCLPVLFSLDYRDSSHISRGRDIFVNSLAYKSDHMKEVKEDCSGYKLSDKLTSSLHKKIIHKDNFLYPAFDFLHNYLSRHFFSLCIADNSE